MRRFRIALLAPLLVALAGCNAVVLHPSGEVAESQRDLLVQSTVLMLLIILPVMGLTVLFAWRYRQSNAAARHDPDWDHSTALELVIWGAPLLIIICLGALTWMGTHLLDPYRPLSRDAGDAAQATSPLEVEVVALDWKWLFVYPQYGVAAVNEFAAPVDRPITFRITASSVMNSFYVPALAGQIYAMPAMQTQLHAVINQPGTYEGFSANYSGAGFSGMHFTFRGLDAAGFDKWMAGIKAAGGSLDRNRYLELAKPSQNVPVTTFASADPKLFDAILDRCVEPGKMCMSEMAAIDAKGGLGLAGIYNVTSLASDGDASRGTIFAEQPVTVASLCTAADRTGLSRRAPTGLALLAPPLRGLGLPPPSLPVGYRLPGPAAGGPSNS